MEQAVQDISGNNDEGLRRRVADPCEKVEQILRKSPEDYARRHNLVAVEERRGPKYMVTIVTKPPGGKVHMIHALNWRIEKAKGADPTNAMEVLARLDELPLAGTYYYWVEWDGTRTEIRALRIKGIGKVVLQR